MHEHWLFVRLHVHMVVCMFTCIHPKSIFSMIIFCLWFVLLLHRKSITYLMTTLTNVWLLLWISLTYLDMFLPMKLLSCTAGQMWVIRHSITALYLLQETNNRSAYLLLCLHFVVVLVLVVLVATAYTLLVYTAKIKLDDTSFNFFLTEALNYYMLINSTLVIMTCVVFYLYSLLH